MSRHLKQLRYFLNNNLGQFEPVSQECWIKSFHGKLIVPKIHKNHNTAWRYRFRHNFPKKERRNHPPHKESIANPYPTTHEAWGVNDGH